jgi:hypothetical protein
LGKGLARLGEQELIIRKIRLVLVVGCRRRQGVRDKWRGTSGNEFGYGQRMTDADDVLDLL